MVAQTIAGFGGGSRQIGLARRHALVYNKNTRKRIVSRTPTPPGIRARGRRLAEHLRGERERQGLAQERLARAADLSVETVRRIERHATPNPAFFTVAALAGALEISLDALLERTSGDAAERP